MNDPKTPNIEDGILNCPVCGHRDTHFTGVTAFHRSTDDAPSLGVAVKLGTAELSVEVLPNRTDNPSARRDAVAVGFVCEACHTESALILSQHKGATFIYHGNTK